MNDHSHMMIWWFIFTLVVVGDDCGRTKQRVQELEDRVHKLEAKP